jgi:ergothioneine biosynthesis protein EgtB
MARVADLARQSSDSDVPGPDAPGPGAIERYRRVRQETEGLAGVLSAEDQCVQSMPDASPAKWHRAHTTWFFEEFLLRPFMPDYSVYDPDFYYLFNSYYEAVGPRHPRPSRGLLTRPSAAQIGDYRAHVDAHMERFSRDMPAAASAILEIGFHHEQQHQELLVTDILHAFAQNPLYPALHPGWQESSGETSAMVFRPFAGGLVEIGHAGDRFAFDNEAPRHQVFLTPYQMATRLVCNQDWLDFIADHGYQTASLWMSDGWARVREEDWSAPLHWRRIDDSWWQMGPGGLAPLVPSAPVRHISWYEADAFARWAAARLPTEIEWEAAAAHHVLDEMTGAVWQWTGSAYAPYPGYRPAAGAIGEYNGKFMVNQMVLRGSSLATPDGHARPSYRNFFHPDRRWQFSGVRLARDI